ncbi:MAG: DUF2784 domain-containing protein [Vicinamibacterales bacterium]
MPRLFLAGADAVVVVHAAFVMFVVLGGLLVARWPRIAWAHVPAVVWGVFVEFAGWICPLTPLEDLLRERAGVSAYRGDFIEHYLLPALYPEHLTRSLQFWLGSVAAIVNIALYSCMVRRIISRRRTARDS